MADQLPSNPASIPESPFERIKRVDLHGNELWMGRDLWSVLGYASWQKANQAYKDAYSSLCLENPQQSDMLPASKMVEIGSGALREVEDWRLSRFALDRVLRRVANHKPEAARELRRRNEAKFRIEIEIGAVLLDFCEQAGLSIAHQLPIEDYKFTLIAS